MRNVHGGKVLRRHCVQLIIVRYTLDKTICFISGLVLNVPKIHIMLSFVTENTDIFSTYFRKAGGHFLKASCEQLHCFLIRDKALNGTIYVENILSGLFTVVKITETKELHCKCRGRPISQKMFG